MNQDKIHVYLMPGLAAGPKIFERIKLPEEIFELHRLEWFVPDKGMSFRDYALRMCEMIRHDNPVLIGVSFGGMLVQEMARCIPVRQVIIVSSVKSRNEMPRRLIFARYTQAHKLLPTGLVNNVELLARYAFGEMVNKRLRLYENYLEMRDKYYLDWSIDKIVHWTRRDSDPDVVHIHGDRDLVFPLQYIDRCIVVKNGSHTMIIHRYRWFNENLPTIILGERSSY